MNGRDRCENQVPKYTRPLKPNEKFNMSPLTSTYGQISLIVVVALIKSVSDVSLRNFVRVVSPVAMTIGTLSSPSPHQ